MSFYISIRSRHPSHGQFRHKMKLPFRSVVRFGSTTPMPANYTFLNSSEAIENSSSKLRMKRCFKKANVKTPNWTESQQEAKKLQFPIVAKSHYGSRGRGNTLIKTIEEFNKSHNYDHHIFEEFYNYAREYRLHVTEDGCFYTCRKMIKEETPKGDRWFRNDSNCVWIIESNPDFDKPVNWKEIEKECVKALKAVGLDFGACDVKVQSAKDKNGKKRNEVDFIIIEINSAPSMGDITYQKYLEMIPKLLTKKRGK